MNMKYVMVLVIAIAAIAEGAEYTVGDDMGWMVPPTPDYYQTWADKIYFMENDDLVFNFAQGMHDVTVLSKEDYDSCNMANPIYQFTEPGALTVEVSDTFYFTCSKGNHCASGQKFVATFNPGPMPPSPTPCPAPTAAESKPLKFRSGKMFN